MSEEWRRVQGFRNVLSLRVTVTADAELQIRSSGGPPILRDVFLRANETLEFSDNLPSVFSVWFKTNDPNCQCSLQAQYREDVTTPILDMRLLYGPMGLGIPLAVTGLPLDITSFYAQPQQQTPQRLPRFRDSTTIEKPEEERKQDTSPGISRLQAFKRELEEEKPKEKEVKKKK